MKEELKKELLECYGYEVVSESPLRLESFMADGEVDEYLTGLPAELLLAEIEKEIAEEESGDKFDVSGLDDGDILLVKANVNYADEFDMEEFTTMSVGSYKELVDGLEGYEEEIEWYFGSNESLSFDNGEDLLSCFTVEKISDEQSDMLDELFGGSFGESGVFDNCWELINGDDNGDGEEYDSGEEEPKSMLNKSDLKLIKKLEGFGWSITEDIGEYRFTFDHSEYGKSYSNYSLIEELIKYYRKNG
jgi:hypothetical protein